MDRSISIIVEWDNVRLSEIDRADQMFAQLSRQLEELLSEHSTLPFKLLNPEMLVLYNKEEITPDDLNACLERSFNKEKSGTSIQVIGTDGLDYYALKNHGADLAKGDILVFIDSDVIPNDTWLYELLKAYGTDGEHGPIRAVSGKTFVEPRGIYSKAFAVGWIFPPPSLESELKETPPLVPTKGFYANNFVIDAEIYKDYRFESIEGRNRGDCFDLGCRLTERGTPMMFNSAAQVGHPPPSGIAHFIYRAVSHGHDNVLGMRRMNKRYTIFGAIWFALADTWKHTTQVFKYRKNAKLSLLGAPIASLIILHYCWFKFLGDLMTRVSPKFVERNFGV